MQKECVWYNGDGQYELLDFDPNGLTKEQVMEKAKEELRKLFCINNEDFEKAKETLYLINVESLQKVRDLTEVEGKILKHKGEMLSCLSFIRKAVEEEDRDMLRSYFEQLNDLVAENEEEN